MKHDPEDRRVLLGQLAFVAFVFGAAVLLLYATSATVSDEEIRVTAPKHFTRAQAH